MLPSSPAISFGFPAWILFVLSGALLTAFSGVFFRANVLHLSTWNNVFVLAPLTLWTQFFFAQAFTRAPKFFVAWFVGTACCAICAIAATRWIFHEDFKPIDALGILLILVGAAIITGRT